MYRPNVEEEKPQLEGFWSRWLFWQRVIPTKIQDRVLLKCSGLHENCIFEEEKLQRKDCLEDHWWDSLISAEADQREPLI